jgi:hypothetical protein
MVFSLWKQQLSQGENELLARAIESYLVFTWYILIYLTKSRFTFYLAHFAFCFLISIPSSLLRNFVYFSFRVMVLKLVASCHWGYGLGKLSTILEMKTLRRQP